MSEGTCRRERNRGRKRGFEVVLSWKKKVGDVTSIAISGKISSLCQETNLVRIREGSEKGSPP